MSSFKQFFGRQRLYADLSDEIRGHLEEKIDELMADGMSRRDAIAAARRAFGNSGLTEETGRDVWRWPLLEDLFQDVRYGLRMLGNAPGFTAIAIVTLALGIGANTAIFSLVYAEVLRPLPYGDSEQLFTVFQDQKQDGIRSDGWSYANFEEVREQNRVFSEMAGTQEHQLTLTGQGEPRAVDTSVVTPEVFSLLGQTPLAGRLFFSEDGKRGAPAVVVLSEGLWRGLFKADPNVIGSAISLDQRSFTVIGVAPAAFRFPLLSRSEQIWIPLEQDPLFGSWMPRRGGHWLYCDRAVEAGSLAAASGGGIGRTECASRKRISGGKQRLGRAYGCASAEIGWKRAVGSAGAIGRGRIGVIDRLRQYCELAADARNGARDERSQFVRRWARGECELSASY